MKNFQKGIINKVRKITLITFLFLFMSPLVNSEVMENPFFSALGLDGQYIYIWPEKDLVLVRFTKYQHQGNIESSVVDIGAGTYHGTESGNMAIYELENLFYAVGDNLEDQIVPTYSDFG